MNYWPLCGFPMRCSRKEKQPSCGPPGRRERRKDFTEKYALSTQAGAGETARPLGGARIASSSQPVDSRPPVPLKTRPSLTCSSDSTRLEPQLNRQKHGGDALKIRTTQKNRSRGSSWQQRRPRTPHRHDKFVRKEKTSQTLPLPPGMENRQERRFLTYAPTEKFKKKCTEKKRRKCCPALPVPLLFRIV